MTYILQDLDKKLTTQIKDKYQQITKEADSKLSFLNHQFSLLKQELAIKSRFEAKTYHDLKNYFSCSIIKAHARLRFA